MDLVDIKDWADDEIRTIHISQVFLDAPYEAKVRRFIPVPGDMLEERWVDGGITKTFPIPPYGIANMAEVANSIGAMIEKHVANYLVHALGGNDAHKLIWHTYFTAFRHAEAAPVRTPSPPIALYVGLY
jgi:hypothetical protein